MLPQQVTKLSDFYNLKNVARRDEKRTKEDKKWKLIKDKEYLTAGIKDTLRIISGFEKKIFLSMKKKLF